MFCACGFEVSLLLFFLYRETPISSQTSTPRLSTATSTTGWSVVFDSLEEWEEFTDSFARVKLKDVRLLFSNLSELLPHIEYLDGVKHKEEKRKLLAELPRRTSDRIAVKAAEKDEMVCVHKLYSFVALMGQLCLEFVFKLFCVRVYLSLHSIASAVQ